MAGGSNFRNLHPPVHIILSTFGTDGDVFPFVGLGANLRGRGHRVTLVTSEDYRGLARDFDLEFLALNTAAESRAVLSNPDFWHPLKGPAVGARWGVGFIPQQFELFSRLAADPSVVFVISPAILAARMAAEKYGRRVATVILQPWMVHSSIAPPIFPGGMTLPRWAPWPVGSLYWELVNLTGHLLIGRHLNRFRRSIGLGPVRRVFRWWHSPQLVIGLSPPAYGPPQLDWPPQIRLAGFPMFDGRKPEPLSADLADFCRAGEAPIAFTFGTGMMHAAHLFRIALEAVGALNARAIFLTRHAGQLPPELPPSIRHAPFAPFQELLPSCSAIVHHGGVGTTSRALAAGIPQLVLPIAYDQTDNAARVKRLGAGDWLRSRQRTGPGLAAVLRHLLSPESRARAKALGGRFRDPSGLNTAASLVEGFAVKLHPGQACDRVRVVNPFL
jgi:rhamnosyltransferase subunit B